MTGGAIGAAIWQAALGLVGTRFRLQGRHPATGLDCIGVVIAAHAEADIGISAIDDYRLRGCDLNDVIGGLKRSGLIPSCAPCVPGDVGLFMLPGRQFHLAILAPGQLVHADAGLRRVALAPANRLPEPHGFWRSPESNKE